MGWVSMEEDIIERLNNIKQSMRPKVRARSTDDPILKKTEEILQGINVCSGFVEKFETEQSIGKLNDADYLSFITLAKQHLQLSVEFVELVAEKEQLRSEANQLKDEITGRLQLKEELKAKSFSILEIKFEISRLKNENKDLEDKKSRFNSNKLFGKYDNKKQKLRTEEIQSVVISKIKTQKQIKCEICNILYPENVISSHKQSCANIQRLRQNLFSKCNLCGNLFRKSYIQQHETQECAKK